MRSLILAFELRSVGSRGSGTDVRELKPGSRSDELAERRTLAFEESLDGGAIAASGSPCDGRKRPQTADGLIFGSPTRENQSQGEKGFVGRAYADRFERTIERRREGIARARREKRRYDLRFGDRFAEKIAIDDFEAHRMRFAAVVLSISLVAAAPAPAPVPKATKTVASLDALLERSRIASGAPYRYHIVSHSHESRQGRTFEVTTETDGPKYRVRSCSKEICSGFYFDGERSFDTNLNDTALPLSSRVDAFGVTLRAIVSYAFAAPDFRANGGQIVEREPILREGRRYRRISIVPPRGTALDALVDPTSGLVDGVLSDERKYAFELEDQRRVDGKVTIPFAIALNGSEIERFESRAIASAPLEAPPGLLPTFSGDATPFPMAKLERTSDQPIVPCIIGGQAVTCLLDTGNSGLSMSLELAETLKIEPHGGAFDISGVGRYATGIVRAPALAVGQATYPAANYVVLHDLHQYGYDVVLGTDAFARTRITIDYGKRTVAFATESVGAPTGGIAFGFENFIPILPVRIGDQTVMLALDTGDESTLNLAYDYYEAHPTLFKSNGSVGVRGIGGTSDEVVGELSDVRLGTFDILRPRIGATKRLPATARGHIGSGLLRHFEVTFDYGRGRLELKARARDPNVRSVL